MPRVSLQTAKRLAIYAAIVLAGVIAVPVAILVTRPTVSAEAIQSSVIRTPALIEKAWALPVAATFQRELAWQSNPSKCGPASLANIFKSLGDGATTEDAVIEGTGQCWLFGYCPVGLTLDELAEVARTKTHRNVAVLRDLTPEQFREHLRASNNPANRYVINFLRAPIFGAGGGHHSPIGGYLEAEDLVFVLDVNESFRPWLIERERLYAAMNTMDGGAKRGLLLIAPPP
jgi:hypothetical protein